MKKTKIVSIVRERGQVTIPETIRKIAKWIETSSVVTISLGKPDEISIRPHKAQEAIDWGKVWDAINLARSFRGKKGNISSLVAEDRAKGHE